MIAHKVLLLFIYKFNIKLRIQHFFLGPLDLDGTFLDHVHLDLNQLQSCYLGRFHVINQVVHELSSMLYKVYSDNSSFRGKTLYSTKVFKVRWSASSRTELEWLTSEVSPTRQSPNPSQKVEAKKIFPSNL